MKAGNRRTETRKLFVFRRIIYAPIVIAIILVSAIFIYLNLHESGPPKAAIIDQLNSSELSLSSRFPNNTFIETAKELLYQRFSQVDYYSDNATVEQYKRLPSLGYKLIVWRVHTALDEQGEYIAICSSESFVPGRYEQYSQEQLKLCNITGDPKKYFAITPAFIKECMSGSFEDTVIILMSCNGLRQNYFKTADAFIEKGVKVFISWNWWINSSQNDHAITLLLQYLINDNNTVMQAVSKVNNYYYTWGAALDYRPKTTEVGNYRIPDYRQTKTASNAVLLITGFFRKQKFRTKVGLSTFLGDLK
jgi:hypothetical protein